MRQSLGPRDGNRLGGKFTENDVQVGNGTESDDERHQMDEIRWKEGLQDGANQRRHRRLTDPPQPE